MIGKSIIIMTLVKIEISLVSYMQRTSGSEQVSGKDVLIKI